ncbi:restriction endonuclease subunit S [Burkholderia multivorans]|nr:restriction endonuclease subunit S [Burkholderia multivorans]
MRLPTYRQYKDSGLEWLGTIPTHWHVDRFKASIISCRNGIWGSEATGDTNDIACVRVADFDRTTLAVKSEIPTVRNVSQSERAERLLTRGNLLLEKSGGGENQPVGQVVIYSLDIPAVCSNFVAKMELAPGMFPAYWNYVHAAAYSVRLNVGSINQTSGIQNLDQARYFDERAPFPPIDEQEAIAAFLDHETSKIDALIAEQEKLLELLAEKRQAIISHAVTRGLNTDVPLKDSGAEWLGMVPEHWSAVPLKHLCTLLKDGTHLPPPRVDIGVPLLSVRNIEDSVFSTREDDSMISTDDYDVLCRAFVPAAGDVLMAIVGATLGKVAIIPSDLGNFHIQRSLAIFRPDESLLAKWLFYCISSGAFQRMLWENVGFSAQPGIYLGTLKEFKIPLPSLPEQAEVCSFLDGEVERLNALKAEASHAIELLNERRSALIFAAVTGKIDVRERSSAMAAAA